MVTAVSQIQQQEGDTDFGLFSIAATYHSAVGDDLEAITSNQDGMREYLIKCLERNELSFFPRTCVVRLATVFATYQSFMTQTWLSVTSVVLGSISMGLGESVLPDTWFCGTHC